MRRPGIHGAGRAASLIGSVSPNVWDKPDEAFAIYAAPGEGETITYQHRDKQGIVISGTEAIVSFI